MNKKIEDYLHLYLGCGMRYATHHEPQNEVYILTVENLKEAIEFKDKPILRPLSDMTEEEFYYVEQHKIYQGEIVQTFPLGAAELTKFLLSKHFDLFGLIEAGLAVDKTTL
jgi:hypothetical protein